MAGSMSGPTPYHFADTWRVLVTLAVMLVFFFSALFNWGHRWKSSQGRRLFLLASVFGMVCGGALLVLALRTGRIGLFGFGVLLVAWFSFVAAVGLAVASFFVRDQPP